jgi:hypothetical protein
MGDFEATEGAERLGSSVQARVQRIAAALCLRYQISPNQISYHQALSVGKPSLCPGSNFIQMIPEVISNVGDYMK